MRHGALPAVMDAPMTSSLVFPAGISCPVTCSSGWVLFHEATTCLPQVTSWALLEYQIFIGPRDVNASGPGPPPVAQPEITSAPAARIVVPTTVRLRTDIHRSPSSRLDGPDDSTLSGWTGWEKVLTL